MDVPLKVIEYDRTSSSAYPDVHTSEYVLALESYKQTLFSSHSLPGFRFQIFDNVWKNKKNKTTNKTNCLIGNIMSESVSASSSRGAASANYVKLSAYGSGLVVASIAGIALGSGYLGWLLSRRKAAVEISKLANELAQATDALAANYQRTEGTSVALGAIDGYVQPRQEHQHLPSGWVPPKREKAGVAGNVVLAATLPYAMQPNISATPDELLTTCKVYSSPSIRQMVHDTLRSRYVAGGCIAVGNQSAHLQVFVVVGLDFCVYCFGAHLQSTAVRTCAHTYMYTSSVRFSFVVQ